MRDYGRDLRVADFIRDEIAAIIQREMRDPRVGMVSVNEAKVSKDLSWVDVYVSSIEAGSADEQAQLVEVLNKAAGYFRSELAKRHSMRTTPKPRFHYDEVIERGPRMEALIDRAVESDVHAVDEEDVADGAESTDGSGVSDAKGDNDG